MCARRGMCRYQSTRADCRLSINTHISWKPPSFLSSTDLLGQWVYFSAPSEVHKSWMMTFFRAGLSLSEMLHPWHSRQIRGVLRATSIVQFTICICVMSSVSHKTATRRCSVRCGSWMGSLYGQSPEEGQSYVHNI